MYQKPPKLTSGDTVAFIAPSLPLLPSQQADYDHAKSLWQSWGVQVKQGRTANLIDGWSAGHPTDQAADIHTMFADLAVRAIIAINGGFSSFPTVDLLDYDLIRQNPKPFIGMSDITVYQWAMLTHSGLLGFHGACATEGFGQLLANASATTQKTIQETYSHLLTQTTPLGQLPTLNPRSSWCAGQATGRLIGGNLKRFVALAGMRHFLPSSYFDGAILFWEEIGESLYDIIRNLYKLQHLGVLDQIAGMVIGRLLWVNHYFDEVDHPSTEAAVLKALHPSTFPILKTEDFGHQMPMLPMVIGLQTHIDCQNLTIEFLEAAVC